METRLSASAQMFSLFRPHEASIWRTRICSFLKSGRGVTQSEEAAHQSTSSTLSFRAFVLHPLTSLVGGMLTLRRLLILFIVSPMTVFLCGHAHF